MIETIVSMPAVSLSLFVVGVICGAVVATLVLPSRRELERLTAELSALKNEHESYKGHVTRHFHKTSELVANMTASYKAVYDHLAAGAQSLCSTTEALEAPKFGSPKLIFDPTVELSSKAAEPAEPARREAATATPRADAAARPAEADAESPEDRAASTIEANAESADAAANANPDSTWRLETADEERDAAEPADSETAGTAPQRDDDASERKPV